MNFSSNGLARYGKLQISKRKTTSYQASKRKFLFVHLNAFELFCNKSMLRLHQMNVGREWQGMFVESREKIVKSINLAKCLKRDIEKWPVCDQELEKSLKLLKVRIYIHKRLCNC